MDERELYRLLEREAAKRNAAEELTLRKPDPLLVAKPYEDAYVALVCALFGYGSARQIVTFLQKLDFSLLDATEAKISRKLHKSYYRFQKPEDVIALFIALRRLKQERSLEEIFHKGYSAERSVLSGISALIDTIAAYYPHESRGYRFLLSQPYRKGVRSTYKRWNMYLRWMVRKDRLDMGLWSSVSKADLLIPLDTHTFHVSRRLGLLKRKSYDLEAVFALTRRLRTFDPKDPVKYDFALYRIGQEKVLADLK